MNRGSVNGNSSAGRSLGNSQSFGGSSDSGRPNFRASTRGSFQGLPSTGGSSNDAAAAIRSQLGRSRNESVNRATWTEGRNGISSGPGVERRLRAGGDASAICRTKAIASAMQAASAAALVVGTLDSRVRRHSRSSLEGVPSNDGGGSRASGFRRGQFGGQNGAGRPTNDQVRNFLNLSNGGQNNPTTGTGDVNRFGSGRRGGGGSGGAGDLTGSMQDRLLRKGDGGPGDGNGGGNGFGRGNGGDGGGTGRELGSGLPGGSGEAGGNVIGRGNRGGGNRGDGKPGDGKFGDGKFGDGKIGDGDRNFGGRRGGDSPGGIGGGGDGRGGNWRDGKGGGGKGGDWRGGELGKGDHRDWSGRWKDGKRFDTAHHIRDDWHGRNWNGHNDIPFHGDWWNGRNRWGHNRWNHWGYWSGFYGRPYYWWDWCSAPRADDVVRVQLGHAVLLGLRSRRVHQLLQQRDLRQWAVVRAGPGVLPADDRARAKAPDFTPEQAQQIEWLPLGVFAVSRDGVVDNNVLVQLAVTKDGVIGGTVVNQTTGTTFDVEGTVDKQSQRAVWTYTDETGKQIAMETSVYNLTQPEATAMIHYGPDNMQVIELVRLEQPKTDADAAGTTVAKPGATDLLAPSLDAAQPAPPAGPAGTLPAPEPAPLPLPPEPANTPVGPVK